MSTDVGSSWNDTFMFLCDHVWNKVKGWLDKILSAGGKEVLINSVAQAIPGYSMVCFRLPRGLWTYQLINPAVLVGKQEWKKEAMLGVMRSYDKTKAPGRFRLSWHQTIQFESTCPAVMAAAQRTQLLERSNSESCLLPSVFNPWGQAWFSPFLDLAEYIGWSWGFKAGPYQENWWWKDYCNLVGILASTILYDEAYGLSHDSSAMIGV
jgi:hypothetical protein